MRALMRNWEFVWFVSGLGGPAKKEAQRFGCALFYVRYSPCCDGIVLCGHADSGGCGRRSRTGTGGRSGCETREELLQVGLQRSVGLLRGRETTGLQTLAERCEILLKRGDRRTGVGVIAAGVMVMMAVMRMAGGLRLLRTLLNGGEVLLRGAEIAGLQIFAERLKCLEDRAGACGRGCARGRGCAGGAELAAVGKFL